MNCPNCGNDELQKHHRFCCRCGWRLDETQRETLLGKVCEEVKATFAADSSLRTISAQEETAVTDGQPSTVKVSPSTASLVDKGCQRTESKDQTNDTSETNSTTEQDRPVPNEPASKAEQAEKAILTEVANAAGEKTTLTNSHPGDGLVNTFGENSENIHKAEGSAEWISPLPTSKVMQESGSEAEKISRKVEIVNKEEMQLSDLKTEEESLTNLKSTDTSTTITEDMKAISGYADDTQTSDEAKQVILFSSKENDAVKKGDNGKVIMEKNHPNNDERTPFDGHENRDETALRGCLERKQEENDAVQGQDGSSQAPTDNRHPVPPTVEKMDGTWDNADGKDLKPPDQLNKNASDEKADESTKRGKSTNHEVIDATNCSGDNRTPPTHSSLHTHGNNSSGKRENDPKGNYVHVVFHALLTPTFSVDFYQGQKVVLRGGTPFSWNATKQIQMTVVREVANGYYVLKGEAKLTLQQVKFKIPYKYVVVGPGRKDLWECLIDSKVVKPAHVNRCLNIPGDFHKSHGTWNQYDDAIFSQPSLWASICNRFPWLANSVQGPAEGRRMAMMVMLPDWDSISLEEEKMSGHSVLREINAVVYCMSRDMFENGGDYFQRDISGFNVGKVLHEYLSARLYRNVNILQAVDNADESQNKRVVTSVMIASLICRHEMTLLRDDELRDLLRCLATYGDPQNKACSGFDAVLRHFPSEKNFRLLADNLLSLCTYVIKDRPGISDWLFAIPLLHFLSGTAKPYLADILFSNVTPPEMKDPEDSWWGSQGLNLIGVRQRAERRSIHSPVHLFHELAPLFEVDPLFKRTFLLALPIRDIANVLQWKIFPLHEVCWALARIVREKDPPLLSSEEWSSIDHWIAEVCDELSIPARMVEFSYEALKSLTQATLQLLKYVFEFHALAILQRSSTLCTIFKLLGRSSYVCFTFYSSPKKNQRKEEEYKVTFQEAFNTLLVSLKKHVIYGSEEWRQAEFQVWADLLSTRMNDEGFQLFWGNEIRNVLNCRVKQIDKTHVMELFCQMDLWNYHREIHEVFMKAAFEALENHSEKSGEHPGVGTWFSLLLKRHWPMLADGKEPSQDKMLQHILSWEPMAQYFKYFGHQIQGRATLPDDGMRLFVSATSLLEHLGVCLRNAEIEVNMLRILQRNRDSFLNLYSLVFNLNESTKSPEMTREARTSAELFLDMRIEELETFEKERESISSFIKLCSKVMSMKVDFDELKQKLMVDVSSRSMHDLCHKRTTNEEPVVKFFELSAKTKRMMQRLHLLHKSDIFLSFWNSCFDRAATLFKDDHGSSETFTIENVQEHVWITSYQRWRKLWERVISGEISIKEVEERFQKFWEDTKALDVEMEMAVTCFPEEDIYVSLQSRFHQIKQCHQLTECLDAAEMISEFKDEMGLDGDFHVLDHLREQMSGTLYRQSLDALSDEVLNVGNELAQMRRPEIECLRTVIGCKEYIFWLRNELKGGKEEVKTLVDLAMMSAGESDLETDRVSLLHTTALAFSPFIFDLNKEVGFNELMSLCDSVWKEIKDNEKLPKMLEDISDHIDWLKGVKDDHAISSLTLVQAINEKGIYCIGRPDDVTSRQPYDKTTVDSVVNLLLPSTSNGKPAFKEYTLEKLKELQSKLALISGKRSSGQDDVDRFGQILQGVIQLGQCYVNLCEVGDVTILDWNKEYKCKSTLMGTDIIKEIDSQSKEFERRCEVIKESINSQRMEHPELNYFTTQQLLFLRKELATLRQTGTINSMNMQVYSLLEKVHPKIHPLSLREVLIEAGILSDIADFFDDIDSVDSDQSQTPPGVQEDDRADVDKQDNIEEKYEDLLSHVEKLGYPDTERLVTAALVSDPEGSVAELVVWCVQNKNNEKLIDELFDEAKKSLRFKDIVGEELSLSSQDSASSDDNESLTKDLEVEELGDHASEENTLDETGAGTYLSLKEMGLFLSYLARYGDEGRQTRREFPSYLKRGIPNLILARKEHVFPAVLALYMGDGTQSLPNSDEVLVCTSETTSEEVSLLWRRALAETGEKIYCLVLGDLLKYDVSQKVVDSLHTLMKDYPSNESLGLVILCNGENEEYAHIVASLEEYKVDGIPRIPQSEELRRYLKTQFNSPQEKEGLYRNKPVIWKAAAEVERANNLNVRVVSSANPGVGKTLFVQRLAKQVEDLPNNVIMAERLKDQNCEPPPLCATIPFNDKKGSVFDAVGFFLPHTLPPDLPFSRIFHLDCSCTVTKDLETLLFNLFILGELADDRGRIWRKKPHDLYVLEISETFKDHGFRFLKLLPSLTCLSPNETLVQMKRKAQKESQPLFDEEEFESEAVQRVWQYLRLFNEDPRKIQDFHFDAQGIGGSPRECLETLIRNCGVRKPSWSEVRCFVNFLNYQLRDCEESVFCDPEITGDTLEGFRTFVVAFMIIMSKDFSMRSLKGKEASAIEDEVDADEEKDLRPFQLRAHWEKSPHPYIFFNPDHITLTFLGFRVDQDGNLLDPQTEEVIKERLMSRHLRTGLHVQRVDFNNDFESYSKADMIQRLCSVMGIDWEHDPDESYELTGDNVKKILAIYMRFRCGIPVVIMGETGCGKTRLIRYLCGLQTGGDRGRKNLLLMKIHGGTTFKDIERNVVHAEAMAAKNAQHDIDTVLFFDEANTTDALGMIKEIIVDQRCNGRPLSLECGRLKFIVACNPYRRHTAEMIRKLESAGLGYQVRADETTERFGKIPLRHLVYRVHALPDSMQSLVWDFGTLQPDVEERYIRRIVGRYVLLERRLPGDEKLVLTISRVLSASQEFMRNKTDECSFVSLRDVKRAMEVMVWFYQRYEQFARLREEENEGNVEESESEDDEESEDYEESEDDEESKGDDEEQKAERMSEDAASMKVECDTSEPFSFHLQEGIKDGDKRKDGGRATSEDTLTKKAEWLYDTILQKEQGDGEIDEEEDGVFDSLQGALTDEIDPVTWALILALGVCYQARLQQRDEYREEVAKAFRRPCLLPGGAERIEQEISRCQQAVMRGLKIGQNIARNAALSENVFMMVVCIELQIPLFVVGKPGSSKSLAKAVVADNMQGDKSPSQLFKTFKQIQLVSYQCSPQSTAEGIMATFEQCSKLQERKNAETNQFASVVVLDEVGLAEDSPKMPLKTLHPLLEDSVDKDDDIIETDDRFPRLAFIGLSNWALDPAKMNRGIMLCRNEPTDNELEKTARGICGANQEILLRVEHLIMPLVSAYADLYKQQKNLKRLQKGMKDEFFGLRDFYSLVKMVFHISKEQKRDPDWKELGHAIRRNFGGLLEKDFNPVNIIMTHLGFPPDYLQNEEDHLNLDCLDLIRASLDRGSTMGQGRYLLILSENFAALPRVKQLLLEQDSEEPYVIFGSSFPKDQLFTQVCRNINRIKICMETGRTVILLNLENLYESLYDVLNQYYVTFGGEKYVDLGLGNHRVKCRVDKNFRLIVIAEKDVVYNRFPIPLINRLEKHFLVMSSGLTDAQKQVTKKLQAWVENFAEIFQQPHEEKRKFTKGDAFVGFHEDSVPAVVLQICKEHLNDGSKLSHEERESWEEKILTCCQERLLQCATPDAVARLPSSRLRVEAVKWWRTYFREQEHSSLVDFLVEALKDVRSANIRGSALRAQVSTHSRLLSNRDIPMIAAAADLREGCVKCVTLQQFQTEHQFCNSVGRDFFARLGGRESLLIVQCDSTDHTLELIACARHLVVEESREVEKELGENSIGFSHIVIIVQLPRVAGGCPGFVSVQSEGWFSVYIDELSPSVGMGEIPPVEALKDRSVSTIFERVLHKEEDSLSLRQIFTSCVQEAASRIEDDEATLGRATRRVEQLIKLISPDPERNVRGHFEMTLAKRLCQLLQERDQRVNNEGKSWLESVALSGAVQETGKFKKAAWYRFQSVVAPVLAELIAYADRDGNLELAGSDDKWVFELWLKVFADSSLTEIKYADFMLQQDDTSVVRTKVPVLKSGYRSHSFQCKFPFSWLLKGHMDELCRDARSIAANAVNSESECLRRLLESSKWMTYLADAFTEGGEAVIDCYLHDFSHMVYRTQDERELEIITRAITVAAKEIQSVEAPAQDFKMDIPLTHIAHSRIQQRLNCLSLFLRSIPDVIPGLLAAFSSGENEMIVDAIALQMCLERMEPVSEDLQETSKRREWCDLVLCLKIPVETTLGSSRTKHLSGEKVNRILAQCRHMWQRLSAVRMFIEHVCPTASKEDVQIILKLWKALGDRTDFSKAGSLKTIEGFLLSCSEDPIQLLPHAEDSEHRDFIQRCNAFFMEIVSVFCFGEDIHHLDPDVFEMLMLYVVGTESTETKQFSPFPGYCTDHSPVVRSFLLQQLLNSSDEKAKNHLERFLFKVQGLSSEASHILNVCRLAVQCMEDYWASTCAKNCDLDLHVNIGIINTLCRQGALPLVVKECTDSDELQVKALEAVAKARYCLERAAEFMYLSVVDGDGERWNNRETQKALDELCETVHEMCSSGPSRSPALFLLKQLVKRYGVHSIATIFQNEKLSWVVPAEFQRPLDEEMPLDSFLVYREHYRRVRDSLAGAILGDSIDELEASLEALGDMPNHAQDIIFLLALYREVTVPQSMGQNPLRNKMKAAQIKDVIRRRGTHWSSNARQLANALLDDSQEPAFLLFPVHHSGREVDKALAELLVHVTIVFHCINFDEILWPLHAILRKPLAILDSYIPTMPEDSFQETRSAMSEGGIWYQCPARHRYFVGDCGKPDHQRDCPECRDSVAIGGLGHELVHTNRLVATSDDRSNKGHILGAPHKAVAERDLSPAKVSLIRAILHSAMLAGGSRQPEVLRHLFVPEIQEDELCPFLWQHLNNDVENLSSSLGRSKDEVLLAIHLILFEIVNRATIRRLPSTGLLGSIEMSVWTTKEARRNWEREFENVFVSNVWEDFEERLQMFYTMAVKDRRLGDDPLLRQVYEVDPVPLPRHVDLSHVSFWRYRTRLTIEHVIGQFREAKSSIADCKILGMFLEKEKTLSALCHLPDIVVLQKILTDRLCRRIDREKASQLTMKQFLQELPKAQREEASKLFKSFRNAWDLVRHQLSSQGRFAPTKEDCAETLTWSSSLSLLLPSTKGRGLCCKGLMFFLVNAHNELVHAYRNSVGFPDNNRTMSTLPLSEVTVSQLVAYNSEKELLPLMLGNCSYSLELGKDTLLQYNWQALEKQIIDRFVRGRPIVEFNVKDFMFRDDSQNDASFIVLRTKIPQVLIPEDVRSEILSEFKDLGDVSDAISTLEIVISFLSSSGGNPGMKITDYCSHVLFLSDDKESQKGKKAQQFCCLYHVLDLWRTLALARAKFLLNIGEDPFPQVAEWFKTEMPKTMVTHFSKFLRNADVESFLSKVVEVIILWISVEDDREVGEMRLEEYITMYFNGNDDDDLSCFEGIPDDVCVKHVIFAWQMALEDSERNLNRRRFTMSYR